MLLETEELYMKMVMPENRQYTLNTTLYPNVPPTTDGHINNIAVIIPNYGPLWTLVSLNHPIGPSQLNHDMLILILQM